MGKRYSQFTVDETKFLLKLHGRDIDIDYLARLMKRDRKSIQEHASRHGIKLSNRKTK